MHGRKPWQFHVSVANYLEWRSGSAWRPLSQRFHPDRFDYVSAINLMNEARISTAACPCPYCAGAPFADERKPVASVRAQKAGIA